jgi:two-component system phosphate regulon sensor histidine kinase PhoR
MLYKKNLTSRQTSLIIAAILSIIFAFSLFFITQRLVLIFIFFILFFTLTYFLTQYFYEIVINRQIKLIYKLIAQTKATKREEFFIKNVLPEKSIEEVSKDVEVWAFNRIKEIEILQENDTFRKEFLQNLSHELKTPIFSIQGYIETLLSGAIHNKEVNTKFLQSASRNIDRLVNLVDDLDEISRLESGEIKINSKQFIIQDLIKEVFETMSFHTNEKQIICSIKKGCEAPLLVNADKEKIRQVLINLIDNSIKYGKPNGFIEASFYKVNNDAVLIEISDNGYGIADEHLIRIFERFYRTDAARSRKIGGSGLGLSICKHIIEAHQQTIHARSSLDVGTTFGFSLQSVK